VSSTPLDPGQALVGLDGLEPEESSVPRPAAGTRPLVLDPEAAGLIREEVRRARGREVCFLAEVTGERTVVRARAVARGNRAAVLAVARDAPEGGVLIHNHPSGVLEPSDADLAVAAQVYAEGLGTAITDNDASAAVLLKNGFAETGRTSIYSVARGEAVPARVFRLDAPDLDAAGRAG